MTFGISLSMPKVYDFGINKIAVFKGFQPCAKSIPAVKCRMFAGIPVPG